nr:transcriptional regulator [Chloroflexia bacterium]
MATMARISEIDETYLAMVKAFPLQRIRDDAELDASIAVIDDL